MSEGRSASWVPNELRWLFKQIRPFFRWHLASFLCITTGSLLALLTPLVLKLLIGLLRHLDTLSADYYDNTPVGTIMYPLKEPIEEISYFGSDLVPAILRT